MNARTRFLLLALLLTLPMAAVVGTPASQPAAHQTGITWLEQLVLADSFRDAGRLATEILAGAPSDARTLAVCGLAFLKMGRIGQAQALFERVTALEPDNPEAHLGLGRIARIRNDPDEAICHLRRAVHSDIYYTEAYRQLWRAAWDNGRVCDLFDIYERAEELYRRKLRPLPSWFANGMSQIGRIPGERLFRMEGRFEHLTVPLVENADPRIRIRMVSLRLNGKGDYLFDIDSASADFLTLSPLLAEELGLPLAGSSSATGVGTGEAAVRFSMLDTVALGGITFRNVPVMVSDLHPFKGLKKGLLGTALLKRFNVTIDTGKKVLELYPLDRPDLLAAAIDPATVAAEVPLYLFDATVVEASVAGAPAALYLLDSAAATNLVDEDFFKEHMMPRVEPARIVRSGIQGAQGAQYVNRVDGLPVALGPLVFEGQTLHEFPMGVLNEIGGRYLAGLLGNPLLWPYRVHMDFRGGRLILEKRKPG